MPPIACNWLKMAFMRALCTCFQAEMGRVRGKVLEICEKMLILRKSA